MKQIRKGVFETNSSSSHSLQYSKKDRGYDYNLPVDKDGTLTLQFGEFGWGTGDAEDDLLKTSLQKISYFITDNCDLWDRDYDSWDEFIKDFIKLPKIAKLLEIIYYKCPQVNNIKFDMAPDSDSNIGYINHQSQGLTKNIYTSEDIENLIFNNSVMIIIDNDNGGYWNDYVTWDEDFPATEDIEELFD
jgi:hypothetical protein